MINNKTNLKVLDERVKKQRINQRPEVNWRRLNSDGKVERTVDITTKSLGVGAAKAGLHAAADNIRGESEPSPGEHAKRVAEGSIVSGAASAAKDVYDTVTDQPNSGEYSDGGHLSNRNADGSPKPDTE
jgi:hypothetical protein